jgi:hypothetical protein
MFDHIVRGYNRTIQAGGRGLSSLQSDSNGRRCALFQRFLGVEPAIIPLFGETARQGSAL